MLPDGVRLLVAKVLGIESTHPVILGIGIVSFGSSVRQTEERNDAGETPVWQTPSRWLIVEHVALTVCRHAVFVSLQLKFSDVSYLSFAAGLGAKLKQWMVQRNCFVRFISATDCVGLVIGVFTMLPHSVWMCACSWSFWKWVICHLWPVSVLSWRRGWYRSVPEVDVWLCTAGCAATAVSPVTGTNGLTRVSDNLN